MYNNKKPYYRKNNKRGKGRYKRPNKQSAVLPKPMYKAVQSIAKKELHRKMEDKTAYKTLEHANYNSGISVQTDVSTVTPFISKGTGAGNRIGEEIIAKSLNMRGYILANLGYGTLSGCRLGVRMMIVQPRAYNGYDAVYNSYATWMGVLLRKGNTTSSFTGTTSDYLAPINSDAIITYYDKRMIVEQPVQYTQVGEYVTLQTTKPFNINLKVKGKKFKYDDSVNGGLSPVDFTPVLLIGYCHLDGGAPDTVNTQIQLSYVTTLKYEDA